MKDLKEKIEYSNKLITEILSKYKNPAIMTSFGKDSVVLIDLIARLTSKIPDCISHKEPFFPKKYRFSQLFSEVYGLTVYDFPPISTSIKSKDLLEGEEIEILNHYLFSLNHENPKAFILPTGIISPLPDQEFLCGLNDLYLKPTGFIQYKWDCLFIGHKSTDTDVFYDSLELHQDVVNFEGVAPDLIYPLRFWTDADIWEYIDKYDIPWNRQRYFREDFDYPEKENMLKHGVFRGQFRDMTFNNDYIEACTLCMSKKQPQSVLCPKLNSDVPNISDKLNYVETQKFKHFG